MNETPRQPQSAIPAAWRAKVAGTLINPDTLLATDYMNHFNEVVMLIEMLPDMPDMLPDCAAWQAKSYPEHFLGSGLDYGPLAAEAFTHLPSSIKVPFDLTTAQLNAVITLTIKRAAASIAIGDTEEMRRSVGAGIAVMRKLTETLAGIINGSKQTMDQDEIDAMLGAANDDQGAPAPAASGGAQADIDKLFG
jgi:hypothetical protein